MKALTPQLLKAFLPQVRGPVGSAQDQPEGGVWEAAENEQAQDEQRTRIANGWISNDHTEAQGEAEKEEVSCSVVSLSLYYLSYSRNGMIMEHPKSVLDG